MLWIVIFLPFWIFLKSHHSHYWHYIFLQPSIVHEFLVLYQQPMMVHFDNGLEKVCVYHLHDHVFLCYFQGFCFYTLYTMRLWDFHMSVLLWIFLLDSGLYNWWRKYIRDIGVLPWEGGHSWGVWGYHTLPTHNHNTRQRTHPPIPAELPLID